jgi:tRNA G18 (ribose-2'-O)-methylase SpoU
VFGQEGPGISPRLVEACRKTVAIEQLGSTRSLNVGVAAGIVMYTWLRQHHLT